MKALLNECFFILMMSQTILHPLFVAIYFFPTTNTWKVPGSIFGLVPAGGFGSNSAADKNTWWLCSSTAHVLALFFVCTLSTTEYLSADCSLIMVNVPSPQEA